MPNPTQKSLHAQIAELKQQLGSTIGVITVAQAKREKAERARDLAIAERDDARFAVARLEGYMARVHEADDAAAERIDMGLIDTTAPRTLIARNGLEAATQVNGATAEIG